MARSREARPPMVYCIGAGGVGFWVIVGLMRSVDDPTTIHVFDSDDLQGGLGHARLPVASPTTRKVDLLRGFLRVNMGDSPPVVHAEKFTGDEDVQPGDLVVDCSDMANGDFRSPTSRKSIHRKVVQAGGRYLRVSYDGASSTMVVAEGLPLDTAGRNGGYTNVPSLALSLFAGGAGAEVVRLLRENPSTEHIEFQISLSDFLVAKRQVA